MKQNNGKENVIIMIIRPMERKGVYTQVLEYNFPKERQSMIGLQVLNRLDKGVRIYEVYTYNGDWIIDQDYLALRSQCSC